ncbi:MAG: ACP S-malonyltransferase [Gammaproteobacteria bacterium]|nr:ACP S-malonyltransferase [Gammaproteobacteria bacterium]
MNKTAFVFPGQGSQKVAMLSDVAAASATFRQYFERAADLLGYDLWQVIANGPAEKLNQTCHTQPALLVADIAMWQLWLERGGKKPDIVAGHSLGEYAALYAAEVIAFDEAVKLVANRAKFMQEAVPEGEGAMAAIIMLSVEQISAICAEAAEGEILAIANINERKQIVIAGHSAAIDRAIVLAKQAGAKLAKKLSVSVPSHCKLMLPAAKRLSTIIAETAIKPPTIAVINNCAVAIETAPAAIAKALLLQLHQPVRWVETIERMLQEQVTLIIECGPNRVLSGQNRRICPQMATFSLNSMESLEELLIKQQETVSDISH